MEQTEMISTDIPIGSNTNGERLNLASFMPYRLNLLAHLVSRGIAGIYEDRYGLTAAQWRVMAAVAEQPGLTAQQVVAITPMDKVTVSRAVAALCESKLLQRQASSTDGRIALLSLTENGEEIYHQIAPQAQDFANSLQQQLDLREREQFLALIDRLIEAAMELAESKNL